MNDDQPTDVDILRAHEWDCKARGCACGWTQKRVMRRGTERHNHPRHVAHMLRTRSLVYPPMAEFIESPAT